MKTLIQLLSLIISIGFCKVSVFGQTSRDQEAIVYFGSGVQRSGSGAVISSAAIQNVLASYGLNSSDVLAAYPDFNETDTLVSDEYGNTYKKMNKAKVFVIITPNVTVRNQLVNSLLAQTEVVFAEGNGHGESQTIPNDSYFTSQNNLYNPSHRDYDIHVTEAWDITTGSANSIIAIIDKGVDITHPDLSAKIAGGDQTYQLETLGDSHGTEVAGSAAASSNNAVGVSGVDWNARILPKDYTNGPSSLQGAILMNRKTEEAVDFGTNVWTLVHSYHLADDNGNLSPYSIMLREGMAYAYKNNRLSCVAAGNSQGQHPNVANYPGGFDMGILTVANCGDGSIINPGSTQGDWVDIAAPGDNVYTTNWNNRYAPVAGTSMAAPQVAGVASLLKNYRNDLYNDDIIQLIERSAVHVSDGNFPATPNIAYGYGRLNARAALDFLRTPYTLQHFTQTGGAVYATTNNVKMILLAFPGVADGTYIVNKIEVRTTVTLPSTFCSVNGVWGVGLTSTGYRNDGGSCYGEGFCDVVAQSGNTVTLRTYIYEISTILGQPIGTYPVASAGAVRFGYSVLGISIGNPVVSGSNTICTPTTNAPFAVAGSTGISAVTWSATPAGLVSFSSASGFSTTVNRVGSANGVATIKATMANSCGTNSLIQRNVVIGSPAPYGINRQGSNCIGSVIGDNVFTIAPQSDVNLSDYSFLWSYQKGLTNGFLGSGTSVSKKFTQTGTYTVTVEGDNSCGTAPDIVISFTLSNCALTTIEAYPNPANNTILVTLSNPGAGANVDLKTNSGSQSADLIKAIVLYDVAGKVAKEMRCVNSKIS
ncbi:S8 family peptidase [Deminuibacter soli]|uniref:PKD domain-containing protein n=1 Tax=Deminuibacter soli TaxID=2291815 RepID=A0A3E1NF66_9BACT|nr:S8 family serine peptidase [Deminuibacter soli]RFM26444.1 hypothetical protein DXN05_19640 [Deminuibacter soli]